jgi:hypothetical protein
MEWRLAKSRLISVLKKAPSLKESNDFGDNVLGVAQGKLSVCLQPLHFLKQG